MLAALKQVGAIHIHRINERHLLRIAWDRRLSRVDFCRRIWGRVSD